MSDAPRHSALLRVDHPLRGIALIVLATIFLGTSDALAKFLSRSIPPIEVTWMRFVVLVVMLVPLWIRTSPNPFRTGRPVLQIWRGIGLGLSAVLFVSSLPFLPIAEASATVFVAPLMVTALSIIFLGERVGFRRWAATIAGLAGVLIVLRPFSSAFHVAAILPLTSALAWAATLIFTRMISGRDPVVTTMTYSGLVSFAMLTVLVPFVWVTPSWGQILLGVCIGVSSSTGQWIVVQAFRYADASVLAPFSYTQFLWVAFLGVVIFRELPDVWTMLGAAIIIASGLYTAQRERLQHSQTRAAKVNPPAPPL